MQGTRRFTALFCVVLLLVAAAGGLMLRSDSRPPNIVLITLESLRPDHVGCYGGPRPTTPVLDALARESVVYED
ncbi:MAG: sulfatase-like hydrolase/transferase, partial [Planctomycetota bacterium]